RKRAGDAYHFVTHDSAGWRVGEVCAAFGVVELAAANRASARSWFERGLRAAALAPETDLVIWNAAGLVETADWPNPDLAATAAGVVRRASADQALATPLGAATWFPTVSSAEPVDHPVTVWQVRNAMREAMVG